MTRSDRIAVGVDGSEGSRAATRWAALEADRLDLRLLLVHASPGFYALGSSYAGTYAVAPMEDLQISEEILAAATQEAEKVLPRTRIDTSALRADARTGLLHAAADARLLVLGDETHPSLSRLITGSVVAPVAAHSPAPVVAVPANWQDSPTTGTVVVGVKRSEGAAEMVRHALQLAASRHAHLVLLHAWDYLAQYDDAIAGHADLPTWEQRARTDLQQLIDRAAPHYPDVHTEVRLVHGQPARVLVDASAEADLLVITRRPHAFPSGRLGGTGRAVLRETRCATLVLPPTPERVDLPVRAEEVAAHPAPSTVGTVSGRAAATS